MICAMSLDHLVSHSRQEYISLDINEFTLLAAVANYVLYVCEHLIVWMYLSRSGS